MASETSEKEFYERVTREMHEEANRLLKDSPKKSLYPPPSPATRDSIEDEIADIAAVESLFGNRVQAARRIKDKLRKDLLAFSPEQRGVTDHALLRYMERHKNIDVNGLRDELRTIAETAEPAKDGEHHWHPSGVILILGEAGQVITVLSAEQAEKWTGRKLKNGERIPPSTDTVG